MHIRAREQYARHNIYIQTYIYRYIYIYSVFNRRNAFRVFGFRVVEENTRGGQVTAAVHYSKNG